MISISVSRYGLDASSCARTANPESVFLTAFGAGAGKSMRQRGVPVRPHGERNAITTAPQTYLNVDVRSSAALHERSP
jgi:hypothetical protein